MGYIAPIEDMKFLLNDVFNINEALGGIDAFSEFDSDLYSAILEEAGKFAESVLYPINRDGDEEGCKVIDGQVITPSGFKQAYKEFAAGGWQGLSGDPAFGGQGLPKMVGLLCEEMTYATNTSFCLYASLTAGAFQAIQAHASDELKETYLPPMLEGRWAGAMGLTEPHAGSDLGIIKSKAAPDGEGAFLVNGTKIFITGGDHDLTENIIHLVLAKLPGAPEGPKGISLFLVPKITVRTDGSLGEPNGVTCGSIEHKMGIKGSATCVMNFDNAKGFLVGEENKGLSAMFTMMNLERLSIGIQGVGLAETAYQLAKAYALDRKQGKNEQGETANIVEHTDVRRMLLSQRAYTEAGRALSVFMGMQIDKQYHHPDSNVRNESAALMALLTPIAKAFFTDRGYEACNYGLQVLGGHGYIREWGLEQLVRDAKIAQIYEGTNGIQAQDLMVRKICLDKNDCYGILSRHIEECLVTDYKCSVAEKVKMALTKVKQEIDETTDWLKRNFENRSYEIQGGATDYLDAIGHMIYAWLWIKILQATEHNNDQLFVKRKQVAAEFYAQHCLPIVYEKCRRVKQGYASFSQLDNELI